MAPDNATNENSHHHRHRHTTVFRPQLQPLCVSSGFRLTSTSGIHKEHQQQHVTTCGTYYGGPFDEHIDALATRTACRCSTNSPHICCLSLREYAASCGRPSQRRSQPRCRTRMLVLQCSMDRTSASKSTRHDPMTSSRAETEAGANIDCDHMSDADSVLCHDTEDNHAGSDVDEADADNMSEDDAPVMEGSAGMTDIPLGDPIADLVLREYDTLAEFDGEANSDDGFDVPSPSEIEPQAPEEAESRLVFGNRIDHMLATAANLPRSYLDPSSFRSRRWLP